jgi:hypothetical protein
MDELKKISSHEWGAPSHGSSTDPLSGIAQRDTATDKTASVAAILAKNEERQIQGVDIRDELEVSLDRASEAEQNDELVESATVGAEARANQR